MLVLLASITVMQVYYTQSRRDVGESQIDNVARELKTTAGKVYYMGIPAKSTLDLYFPDNIKDICIGTAKTKGETFNCDINEIIFLTQKDSEMVYSLQHNVLMDPNPFVYRKVTLYEGMHRITLEASDSLELCTPTCPVPPCDLAAGPIPCNPPIQGVLIYQK